MSLYNLNTHNQQPLNPIHFKKSLLESHDQRLLAEVYWDFVLEMSSFKNTPEEKIFFKSIYDPSQNSDEVNQSILNFIDIQLDKIRKDGMDDKKASVYELMYLTLNVHNRPTSLPRVLSLWTKLTDSFALYEDEVVNKWFSDLPIQVEYENALDSYNYLKYLSGARPWFM